jgi:hypothetical protein
LPSTLTMICVLRLMTMKSPSAACTVGSGTKRT